MSKKMILVVLVLSVVFFVTFRASKKEPIATETKPVVPVSVTVASVKESRSLVQHISFPAETVGDQEVTLTARASGTVTWLNAGLGSGVTQGVSVATIDSVGAISQPGVEDLRSGDAKALDYAKRDAEAALRLAKAKYNADDTTVNKRAKDIAEIQLKAATAALKAGLDTRLVVAPISGVVTRRLVSVGDSVSQGQPIAMISPTGRVRVDFFVSQEERVNFSIGTKVAIEAGGESLAGVVSRMAPEADPATRRFLVEVTPLGKRALFVGTIAAVSLDVTRTVGTDGNILLPLSAITVGQNGSRFFIAENGFAKEIAITIAAVRGDLAEVRADIPDDADVILIGSKLVADGSPIVIAE